MFHGTRIACFRRLAVFDFVPITGHFTIGMTINRFSSCRRADGLVTVIPVLSPRRLSSWHDTHKISFSDTMASGLYKYLLAMFHCSRVA